MVDASCGTHDDRKLRSGCNLHIGAGYGSFLSRSKKQTMTADSSAVAQFIATHLVTKDIMLVRARLGEMGHTQLEPAALCKNNLSTIEIVNNDSNSNKTKDIETRFNLIREQVLKMIIELQHLAANEMTTMTTDIITKALDPQPFTHLRTKLIRTLERWLYVIDSATQGVYRFITVGKMSVTF